MISITILAASLALAPVAAIASTVTITVSGVQAKGRVFGQVFADSASFSARDHAVLRFAIEPASNGRAGTTITLPPGQYAIALFQDTKGTGRIETNFLGIPVVPFGFSNNARGAMGPPKFDAAAFTVGGTTSLEITLR